MDVAALRAGAVGRRRVTPVKPARKLGAKPFGLTGVPFADAALKTKPGQSGFASREHPQIGEGRGAPAGNFAPQERSAVTTEPTSTRPDHLTVIADHTPGEHATDSEDFWWWLPVIGPSGTLCAYLLSRHAAHGERTWDTAELAASIGLGGSTTNLWRTLERLNSFGVLTFVSTDVATIRLQLPALQPRQLTRLPAALADAYRQRAA